MKKTIRINIFLISIFLILFSCNNPANWDNSSGGNNVSKNNVLEKYYKPRASEYTIFYDDFEDDALTSKNQWKFINTELTSLQEITDYLINNNSADRKDYYSSLFGGQNSKVAAISTSSNKTSSISLSNLSVPVECVLTYKYFIVGVQGTTFNIYLNDDTNNPVFSEKSDTTSNCFNIKMNSITIPAGTTSITFEAKNSTRYSWSNWPNNVYIDDISLVQNKVADIFITPRSSQKTYIGCPDDEKIRVKAYALRADGTVIPNKNISFLCFNGTVDKKGLYTPALDGEEFITASCDNISVKSGKINIYKSNSCEGDCTVGNVTYKGIITDNGTALSKNKIELEYPKTNTVTADGFIRFKGKLKQFEYYEGKTYDKVAIFVTSDKEKTLYICDQDFDVRVWLPFGTHIITIGAAYTENYTYTNKNGKICEGDYKQYSWYNSLTINATDTHTHTNESSGASDGRYVYPSFYSQSDSYLIQNLTNEVLYELPENASDKTKFKAIHDYIVSNYYYDYDSTANKGVNRKKQDAVSMVVNGTGVCAGYASLTSAMCRCAGIPARYISSENLNHAWNHIRTDGIWYFCDITWDDPDKAPDSNMISYKYYLLENFDGINKDHDKGDNRIEAGRTAGPVVFGYDKLPLLMQEGNWF